MKKKNYFLSVIFSLFALSGILTSCENINWFANFMDDLNALKVPFTFYSAAGGTGTSFEKSYIIGKTISGEQLVNDSKDFILEKGADGSTPYPSHAVVHGLKKNTTSSGDDGVETDINGFVTSVEVKQAVSFVPVIWYNAEITCMYEDLGDPSDYSIEGEKFFFADEAGSRIAEKIPEEIRNKYELPGFRYDGLIDNDSQFSSTQTTSASMKYKRKTIDLTFNANGGNFSGSAVTNTVSGPYESEILNASSGSYKAPERSGYTFVKWNPPVPDTFPADNATFTAVWSVTPQDITYKTVNACDSENHFPNLITNIDSLPSQYTPGEIKNIPNPEIFLYNPGDNDMLFDGWYYIGAGNTLVKLPIDNNKYYIDTDKTGPLTLCAKWLPKYVYVDPNNSTSDCNGFESASPVKTIANARLLMKDNLHGQEIRVLGSLTDAIDINELSETYGNGCRFGADTNGDGKGDGVIIVPDGKLLDISDVSTSITLSNVTIGRTSQVSIGNNNLINAVGSSNLSLGSGCVIRNIKSTNDDGLILSCGNITLNSGAEIKNCTCSSVIYGKYLSSSAYTQSINLGGGTISNCTGDAIKLSGAGAYINLSADLTYSIDLAFDDIDSFVGKLILKSAGTPSIPSNKLKFNLPSGYLISDEGYLTKTTGEIVIDIPTGINEHLLGNFDASDVVIESGGKIIFKVSDDAYSYIANWGSEDTPEKYVMYQISCSNYGGRTYKAKINSVNQSGYHTVELPIAKLVPTDNSAASISPNLEQLPVGLYEISVFVETAPDKITTDSVTGVREMILFHK